MAEQLTAEGLDVVAIERGPWRDTARDFSITEVPDELHYRIDAYGSVALVERAIRIRRLPIWAPAGWGPRRRLLPTAKSVKRYHNESNVSGNLPVVLER
jgi:hypothetical protein